MQLLAEERSQRDLICITLRQEEGNWYVFFNGEIIGTIDNGDRYVQSIRSVALSGGLICMLYIQHVAKGDNTSYTIGVCGIVTTCIHSVR